jgi:hypothetical protein
MKLRHLGWVIVPILVGAASYVARPDHLKRRWKIWTGSDPIIECPQSLDMGEHELGEIAVARFFVANRGGKELIIDQVRTNCSCSGLEREENGQLSPIEKLSLASDERVQLAMRISVRGQPGNATRNRVSFRTNDPTRPEVHIEAVVPKVTGAVTAAPTSVIFGTVPVGSAARQVFEVHDGAVQPRKVVKVVSTNPDRLTARLLPAVLDSIKTIGDSSDSLIGRVEVILATREPGPVSGEIQIHLVGGNWRPVSVSVQGRVARLVEAHPPSLVLPRSSGTGPVYFGNCLCRCASGKVLALRFVSAPQGVTASVSPVDGSPSVQMVRIEWDPASGNPRLPARSSVRFAARVGGHEETLEIPVECRQR